MHKTIADLEPQEYTGSEPTTRDDVKEICLELIAQYLPDDVKPNNAVDALMLQKSQQEPMINRLLVPGSLWREADSHNAVFVQIVKTDKVYYSEGRSQTKTGVKNFLNKFSLIDTGLMNIAEQEPPEDCIIWLYRNSYLGQPYRVSDGSIYTFDDGCSATVIDSYSRESCLGLSDFVHWRLSGPLAEMAIKQLRGIG